MGRERWVSLRMRGTDESLPREGRLKPVQQKPAASEFHGLKLVAEVKAPAKGPRAGIRGETLRVARALIDACKANGTQPVFVSAPRYVALCGLAAFPALAGHGGALPGLLSPKRQDARVFHLE